MALRAPRISVALGIAILFTLSGTAGAQWLRYKTPGIPRTADGEPDLSAPAPRTADGRPDLSGVWAADPAGDAEYSKAMAGLKALPWAQDLSQKRQEDLGKDDTDVLVPAARSAGLDGSWQNRSDSKSAGDAFHGDALPRGFSGWPPPS